MSIRPAPIDPPEIHHTLWDGFVGEVGWDVGANCGQTLPEISRRFTYVAAFEPAVECHQHLARWVGRDGIVVCDYAVSDVDGEIQLAALPDKIDTGQLVSPGTHGMEWDPDIPEAVARTVKARRIDTLVHELPPPTFIKVDVEGHEARVLDGAATVIDTHRPAWLIEFHTPELYDYCHGVLTAAGYRIDTIRHPHYAAGGPMWRQHGWLKAFPA